MKLLNSVSKIKKKFLNKIKPTDKKLHEYIEEQTRAVMISASLQDFNLLIKEVNMDGQCIMTMNVDYEYLRAYLEYDKKKLSPILKAGNQDEILRYICHEVAHIITSELVDTVGLSYKGHVKFYLERQTERVGRIIYSNYTKKNGKK